MVVLVRGGDGDCRGLRRGCARGGLEMLEGVVADVVESPLMVTSVVFQFGSRGGTSGGVIRGGASKSRSSLTTAD